MLSRSFTKINRASMVASRPMSTAAAGDSDQPKRVLISGAAGQIAYSIVFRIAS